MFTSRTAIAILILEYIQQVKISTIKAQAARIMPMYFCFVRFDFSSSVSALPVNPPYKKMPAESSNPRFIEIIRIQIMQPPQYLIRNKNTNLKANYIKNNK